jgi:hypothetical protein
MALFQLREKIGRITQLSMLVPPVGCQFAEDGKVEDSLAELLDVFGFRSEALEVVKVEAGVAAEGIGLCAIVQATQRRRYQPIPPALPFRLYPLEPITERHEFIHLSNNAVLFSEGWEG